MVNFSFEIEKTKASLLFICQELGGECDKYLLLKILYFAEKAHLGMYGRPITGDSYSAIDYGPVPSYSYDTIKGDNSLSVFFQPSGEYLIRGLEAPDMDELSQSDVECLLASIKENKGLSFGEIKHKSHDMAYKLAPFRGSMSMLEIAAAAGASTDMIDYIKLISENNLALFNAPSSTDR